MLTRIAAAIFALFAVTAPAHAVMVDYDDTLDANLNLNFGSSEHLTGELGLQWLPIVTGCCRSSDYVLTSSNLSLNGIPLVSAGIPPNAGPANTVEFFTGPSGQLQVFPGNDFVILGLNTNFLPPNPTFANFVLNRTHGTSGTVTVNSEHLIATPLPAALSMFGTALAGLGGAGWWKRRRKVSR